MPENVPSATVKYTINKQLFCPQEGASSHQDLMHLPVGKYAGMGMKESPSRMHREIPVQEKSEG